MPDPLFMPVKVPAQGKPPLGLFLRLLSFMWHLGDFRKSPNFTLLLVQRMPLGYTFAPSPLFRITA